MVYRVFSAVFWAGLCGGGGELALWLLAHLELPPALQAHHPMSGPASSQFEQTRLAFVSALAITGAAWGALLPAKVRYSERKLRELEATAKAITWLWGLFTVMVVTLAVTDDRSIWIFAAFAAAGTAAWHAAAALLRLAARVLVWRRRGLAEAEDIDEADAPTTTSPRPQPRPTPTPQRAE